MFSRQAVIDHWQQCLAAAESLAAEPPSRFRFYQRMRVRLYRFLLACYGSGEWQADEPSPAEDRESSPSSSALPLVEDGGPWEGKPPRAGDSIRTVLEHIHAANEGAASAGSMTGSSGAPTWIAATAQSADISPERCCRLLRSRGTQVRQVRRGDDVIVEVPRDDLDDALRLIEKRRESLRIRRQDATPLFSPARLFMILIGWLLFSILSFVLATVCAAAEARPYHLAALVTWVVAFVVFIGFPVWWTARARRRPIKIRRRFS